MVGSRPRIAVHYNVCVCVYVNASEQSIHQNVLSPSSPSLPLSPSPPSLPLNLSLSLWIVLVHTVSGLVLCTDRGGEVDMLVEVWVGMWWWRMQDVACINDDSIRGCRREG